MKNILLSALLLMTQGCAPAFALTTSTQNANTPKITDRLDTTAPLTQTGDKKYLLEDSKGENFLINPSFEHSTVTTGWTVAGTVTAVAETTDVKDGKKSLKLTLASTNGLVIHQDVTPTQKLQGDKLPRSIRVKTTLTTVQVCAREAGATIGTCSTVFSDGAWYTYSVSNPGPASGSVGLSVITTGSTSGDLYVDDGIIGRRPSQYAPLDYARRAYTPTFTNLGTVTNISCGEARQGEFNVIDCRFTTGTVPGSGEARVSLPGANLTSSTITSIRTARSSRWNRNISTASAYKGGPILIEPGVGYITFGLDDYTTAATPLTKLIATQFSSSTDYELTAVVPVTGWDTSSEVQAVNAPPGPTRQYFTASGTYIRPNNVKRIEIFGIGCGGGGSGSAAVANDNAGNGGNATSSTFGSVLTLPGGSGGGGGGNQVGGVGGTTPTITAPAVGTGFPGSQGASGSTNTSNGGGGRSYGGLGGLGLGTGAGSGAGGRGGELPGGNNIYAGAGGGSGSRAKVIINNPAATYTVTMCTVGGAGAAGTSGTTGIAGELGSFEVWEYYTTGDVIELALSTALLQATPGAIFNTDGMKLRIEQMKVSTSDCTVGVCAKDAGASTAGITATWSSTGGYNIAFSPAYTTAPVCVVSSSRGSSNHVCQMFSTVSTTSTAVNCTTGSTGSAVDSRFNIICFGGQ